MRSFWMESSKYRAPNPPASPSPRSASRASSLGVGAGSEAMAVPERAPNRRWSFSLRTLFVVVTVCAVLFLIAGTAYQRRLARLEAERIAKAQQLAAELAAMQSMKAARIATLAEIREQIQQLTEQTR